ncbi:MAG: nickel pincer cofactor biosynthesis protein LarC [Lachnospiraceae bacterium]|nr:nickel pincer cofactor biosynthesis protein LarC [Lachnospiraceae bacterium]
MKTLYLECSMGAAGDMLSAALYELLDDKEGFINKINNAGIPKVTVNAEPMTKCGILGTHINVFVDGVSEGEEHHHEHEHDHDHHHDHHHDHEHEHEHEHEHAHESAHSAHTEEHHHEHHHSSLKDIESIIDALNVPEKVKTDAKSVYMMIAEAESNAHGKPVSEIHFHEVGTMDAIADITMVCMLMNELKAEKIIASEIHVGSGHVHCAHGILPVPAPATAYILRGIPFTSGHIKGELCTPTGAALIKYFASQYGEMPVMTVDKIGYGMGKKDFEQANCVRAFLGSTNEKTSQITELSCNIDDMTGEKIGFAMEKLFEAGALEVYTVPVGMKKSRPGILLSVMCNEAKKDEMVSIIFKYTTTLGVRENVSKRYTLKREIIKKETPFGEIRIKKSKGFGVVREKYEYEDLARIANEKNISIDDILKELDK